MEYHGSADGSDPGTSSGDSSESTDDSSSVNHNRRRILPPPFPTKAYLDYAFSACASNVDVDPSLLRYTRPRPSSTCPFEGERQRLMTYLQSPIRPSTSTSPYPMGMARIPAHRPSTVYCTPSKASVMDGVLVINDELPEHNRIESVSARRRLDLGSNPAFSTYTYNAPPPSRNFGSYLVASTSGGRSSSSHWRNAQMGSRRSVRESLFPTASSQVYEKYVPDSSPWSLGNMSSTLPTSYIPTEALVDVFLSAAGLQTVASINHYGITGEVNTHSSEPSEPQDAESDTLPSDPAATNSAEGIVSLPEPAAGWRPQGVWKRTKEEKLMEIVNGLIPLPPPPSASTFTWPPTEEQEAEIQRVLRGSGTGSQLPAFKNFRPDD